MANEDLSEDEAVAGPRQFHIAEWYGRPFLDLTDAERGGASARDGLQGRPESADDMRC